MAQSSVTLYGNLDVGIDYVSNAHGSSMFQESSGKRMPDKWGIRVVEDLGGGTEAIARLESGFVTNTGAQINPTSFFNREAYVGLSDKRWGTVTFGNSADFVYNYVGALNNSVPGISSFYSPGNLDGLANSHAMTNTVRYETIKYRGFQVGVMNGFGNQAGDFSAGRQYSLGAQYQDANVRVGLAYTMSHNRTADIFGVFSLPSLLGQKLASGTMFNASRYSTLAVGGSVKFGSFVPHATFTDVKLADSQGSASMLSYEAGVNIDLSGGLHIDILGLSASRSTFEGLAYNQANLFYTHYLSPSTQIYAGVGVLHGSGPNVHASQFNYTPSSNGNQTVARIGVWHMF